MHRFVCFKTWQLINFTRQLHLSCPFFLLSTKYVNVHLISRFVKNICWYIHLFTTMMRSAHRDHNKIYNFKRLPTKTCSAFNYIMRNSGFFFTINEKKIFMFFVCRKNSYKIHSLWMLTKKVSKRKILRISIIMYHVSSLSQSKFSLK